MTFEADSPKASDPKPEVKAERKPQTDCVVGTPLDRSLDDVRLAGVLRDPKDAERSIGLRKR